jgi:photosystem II stability/assembly factor-like uncharacterized protein/N-acetylneuraminic acid mutarotase
MRSTILHVLLIVSLCTDVHAQSDSLGRWFTRAPLPTPRQEIPHAVLNGRIYVPGGLAAGGVGSRVVEVFDPAANSWSTIAQLPEPLHHLGFTAANGRLYTIGGYMGSTFTPTNRVYEYLPDSNLWRQKASMPTARGAHVALTFGGKIYAIGGIEAGVGVSRRNDEYDPVTDSWQTRTMIPTAREHLAGAVIDTLIYIVGGRVGSSNRNTLEAYSPASNTWYTRATMPTARGGLAAATMNGRMYVFGGEIPGVYEQNEEYNPATNAWRTMAPMPTPRHGIGAATVGDSIFIIGGATVQGFGVSDANEVFTLAPLPSGIPRWRTLPNSPPAGNRHDDVFFINPLIGWVVNGGGNIWKTTNGGGTWTHQFTTTAYLRSVGFADSLTGWVGTLDSNRVLYQTTDGGTTWSLVQNIPPARPAGICGISVVNDSVVYASGRFNGPARMIKTTDRGQSWTSIDLSAYASALVDCHFFNPESGFVVGATGSPLSSGYAKVLFTSDGGATWITRHTGNRAGELCWKIQFRTPSIGYVSIEKFSMGATYYLKTIDGGITWIDQLFQNTRFDVQGIGFISDSLGWIGGWFGGTYETTDAGSSWHLAGFGLWINRFRFLSDTLAYAVGSGVYKYSIDSVTVDVAPNPIIVPTRYRLEQNYPNPFNPSTVIGYSLPVNGFVLLKVYNVLGQEVATLVDEVKQSGIYSITWNAKNHPGGVYVYRMTANDFIETKKLILIK